MKDVSFCWVIFLCAPCMQQWASPEDCRLWLQGSSCSARGWAQAQDPMHLQKSSGMASAKGSWCHAGAGLEGGRERVLQQALGAASAASGRLGRVVRRSRSPPASCLSLYRALLSSKSALPVWSVGVLRFSLVLHVQRWSTQWGPLGGEFVSTLPHGMQARREFVMTPSAGSHTSLLCSGMPRCLPGACTVRSMLYTMFCQYMCAGEGLACQRPVARMHEQAKASAAC